MMIESTNIYYVRLGHCVFLARFDNNKIISVTGENLRDFTVIAYCARTVEVGTQNVSRKKQKKKPKKMMMMNSNFAPPEKKWHFFLFLPKQ